MKVKRIVPVSTDQFQTIFETTDTSVSPVWKSEVKRILENYLTFSMSDSFWFIGDFTKGNIIEAGGFIEKCSPWKKQNWIGLNPMQMIELIHPEDIVKLQSYIFFIADYFSKKSSQSEIDNTKVSLIFRMLDSENEFTWRIMTYPKAYYLDHKPIWLLTMITDYDNAQKEEECRMFILDRNHLEKSWYVCTNESPNSKDFSLSSKLTLRELEILFWLSKGFLSKEIAGKLLISKNTVENHKQNIYKKTSTRNLAELINYANKNRLV